MRGTIGKTPPVRLVIDNSAEKIAFNRASEQATKELQASLRALLAKYCLIMARPDKPILYEAQVFSFLVALSAYQEVHGKSPAPRHIISMLDIGVDKKSNVGFDPIAHRAMIAHEIVIQCALKIVAARLLGRNEKASAAFQFHQAMTLAVSTAARSARKLAAAFGLAKAAGPHLDPPD